MMYETTREFYSLLYQEQKETCPLS